mmetsp:Transcript_25224/g.82811  ORF Transcript_25224/g.82811 Transcript_25224/m.82811 type:complete len:82 (-) Transcript_25224:364-609(-)
MGVSARATAQPAERAPVMTDDGGPVDSEFVDISKLDIPEEWRDEIRQMLLSSGRVRRAEDSPRSPHMGEDTEGAFGARSDS